MKRVKNFIQSLRERYYYKRGMLDKIPNLVAPYSTSRHYHPNLPIQIDEEFPKRLAEFLEGIDHSLSSSRFHGSRDRVLEYFITTIFQLYSKHMLRTVSPNQDFTPAAPHVLKITTDEIAFSADLAISALECDILHDQFPPRKKNGLTLKQTALEDVKPPICS